MAVVMDKVLIFYSSATYDVQNASLTASGQNKMDVTVEYIGNTTAKGCFIVLQNSPVSPGVFVAVPQSQSSIENIPASMYTVFFYDLEQDGIPSTSPAYEQTNITVSGKGKKTFCHGIFVTDLCLLQNRSHNQCQIF